jgi:type VI secretion system protein ImpG
MLSGQTPDPDVERLLEGCAFLTGMVNEKVDDEFPEIVHGLMQLIFPHYLRPIPATTILRFNPKQGLMETLKVPAGAQVASIPVEDTSCVFTTCYDVELAPLSIVDARLTQTPGRPSTMTLRFSLDGLPLSSWEVSKLRVHIAGGYAAAADRYSMLFNNVREITIRPLSGGSPITLPKSALKPVGFADDEALLPYPRQSFPGYRILQEYFILPEKFFFFDITGFEQWTDRGEGGDFEVIFHLAEIKGEPPTIRRDNFILFATPIINLFSYEADPILLDHQRPEYSILPSGGKPGHYQVYSVNRVVGYVQGTVEEREYLPFELFNPQVEARPVYTVTHRRSPLHDKTELFLSVAYPPGMGGPTLETLSLDIMCTNASLPEKLQLGDISRPTESSPGLASFENIRPPTAPVQPPLGKNLLWRLLSHLFLNYLSVADMENLRALIKLYIFTETRDRSTVLANTKRVDSITDMVVEVQNRIVGGVMMRGQQIQVTLDRSSFAGIGDMYLFGAIMDYFLSGYAEMNCFTQLFVVDSQNKEHFAWPARIGDRPLM